MVQGEGRDLSGRGEGVGDFGASLSRVVVVFAIAIVRGIGVIFRKGTLVWVRAFPGLKSNTWGTRLL